MERTQRKRTPSDQESAPEEQVEVDTADREAKLADIDETLDTIEDVLEENEILDRVEDVLTPLDPDPYGELHAIGLYGPDDLDEAIAAELAEYARQEEAEALASLEVEAQEEEYACTKCGMCPVLPGCPYQTPDGEVHIKPYEDTGIYG